MCVVCCVLCAVCCVLCVLSCVVLSCVVLSCLVLSCLVLSCLVLSCLVLSCLVLSCLVFSFCCLVFFLLAFCCVSIVFLLSSLSVRECTSMEEGGSRGLHCWFVCKGEWVIGDNQEHSYSIVRCEILEFVTKRTTPKAFATDVFIDQERR